LVEGGPNKRHRGGIRERRGKVRGQEAGKGEKRRNKINREKIGNMRDKGEGQNR
jgi:hypothetical protein